MQQPCPNCGFVTDRPSRFCRQCGKPLVTESETSSAATRNYGAPPSAEAFPPQAPAQGQSGFTPETIRFYQPPVAQNLPPYPVQPPRKSRAGMWFLIALLSFFLVGGGMAGMFLLAVSSQKSKIPSTFEPKLDEKIQAEIDRIQAEAEKAVADAEEKADQAAEQSGAGNVPGAPADPPVPPPPGSTALDKFKYPNATMIRTVRAIGTEVLTLRTADGFDKVRDYYKKLIGSPIVEDLSGDKNQLVFQSSGPGQVLITIEPDEEKAGHFLIHIVRTPFSMPKIN